MPLNYTQEGFITFVQSSPLPNMPAFPDASAQQLADIYAYIRTIPADAPALGDVPLLRDILERKTTRRAVARLRDRSAGLMPGGACRIRIGAPALSERIVDDSEDR